MKSIIARSEQDTAQTAQNVAAALQGNEIILLHGPLGSGKTVFARAMIRALTDQPELEVPSPTYTLVQIYDASKGPVNHYDLYRLKNPEEIYELGWEESAASGITIVEWPERLGPLSPKRRIDIRLANVMNEPHSRKIEISQVDE